MRANRQTYLALDGRQALALDTKIKGRGIQVLGTLAEWNRADVRVQTIPGRLATKVIIDHADGDHYELESTNISGLQPAAARRR